LGLRARQRPSGPDAPGSLAEFGSNTTAKPQNLVLNYTRTLTPNLINEFRSGFLRAKMTSVSLKAFNNDLVSKFGIIGLDTDPRMFGMPNFAATGFRSP